MMTVSRLLAVLYRAGVGLEVRDGRLVVHAPKGALTPELRAAIVDRYDDLYFIADGTPIRPEPLPLEADRAAKALDAAHDREAG